MSVITVATIMAMGTAPTIYGPEEKIPTGKPAGAASNNKQRQPPPPPGVGFLQSDTTSREGSQVWTETTTDPKTQIRMWNFPAHYSSETREGFYSITTSSGSVTTPQNARVVHACPKGGGECEVVVFVYECSPCPGRKDGLQYYLMVDKHYKRTRCAPTFTIGGSNVQHRMTAYVKSIPDDTIETIQIPNDTDLIAFGMSNGERPSCSSFGDQPSCEDTAARCVWNNNNCELRQCIAQGPFPPGGCNLDTCALEMI